MLKKKLMFGQISERNKTSNKYYAADFFKNIIRGYILLWQNLQGYKAFLFYLVHYALIFFLLQDIVFGDFYKHNRTFIWKGDGLALYLPSLAYINQTVQSFWNNLVNGSITLFPLYDFTITPAKASLAGKPIIYLAALFPKDKLDVCYDILFLLRLFLAGLSFSLLGFYFKQKSLAILIGAISYIFCGFTIFLGVRHPSFLGPMIILPILIIGVELIFGGKLPWLFISVVFLSLVFSLYFSCMLAILIFIYIGARFICKFKGSYKENFLPIIGRIFLAGCTGIALSGFVIIPTFIQMMNTGRVGRDIDVAVFYNIDFYEKFLSYFIVVSDDLGYWTNLGFSVLALPCIFLLFGDKNRKNKILKILFIIMTIMLLLPIVSYIMSGFDTLSNRWTFAYTLCVSVIIMVELPRLSEISLRKWIVIVNCCLIYIALCYFVITRNFYYEQSLVMLAMSLFMIGSCYFMGNKGKNLIMPLCLLLACLSSYYGAFISYSPWQKNFTSEFAERNEVYGYYDKGSYALLADNERVKNDSTFFRVDGSSISFYEIQFSPFYGLNGSSFYSSSISEGYRLLQNELEILQRGQINIGYGNDARGPLLSLYNVKYYVVDNDRIKPFGFTEIERNVDIENTDIILQNENFLPLGYTYEYYVTSDVVAKYSGLEKQELMLSSVILDTDFNNKNFVEKNVDLSTYKLPVDIILEDGIKWNNGYLEVTQENAKIILRFQGLPKADTYLRLVDFVLISGTSSEHWFLDVCTEFTKTKTRVSDPEWDYGHTVKTQLLYLGNSPEGYTTCTLTFPQKGTFILDDLEIWCQPMDNYAAQIEALRAEPLENIETNWRGLTGTVDLSKDKIMCFGIPYETGWSVYVDGEKRELMQANIGLMAVELEAGYHDIELKYWLPGLTAGIIMSLFGVLAVCGIVVFNRRNKIKKRVN